MRINLTVILLTSCLLQVSASSYAQKINLTKTNISLIEVFRQIRNQSGYDFVYSRPEMKLARKVDIFVRNASLKEVLDQCFANQPFTYEIQNKAIIIKELTKVSISQLTIPGRVTDMQGNPLPKATIYIQGTRIVTSADDKGRFELPGVADKSRLVFSSVGYMPITVRVEGKSISVETGPDSVNMRGKLSLEIEGGIKSSAYMDQNGFLLVRLARMVNTMETMVVTGIYTRPKESFTGSAATYTQKELRMAGGTNVLQSLKTIDPAFAVLDNVQFGSDPNRLPNLEIRGKSSILGERDNLGLDPNQPLFILDGFESTLSVINDLDINRIESITLLKDAASTAIYGSKAANGVVVVETVKPKAGKLQVSYSGNTSVSAPDLSSYNLMNAKEKLQFELMAGMYTPAFPTTGDDMALTEVYNQRLRAVAEGVDTYWLAEPLRVGVNQKHSLYVMGGHDHFLFGLGGGYNGISGVMNRSDRTITNGNIDLSYRVSKFQFSNKFTASTTVSANPLVSFSEFAKTNPFYKKRGSEGIAGQWLENNGAFQMANPIWDANLNSRDEGRSLIMTNYFVSEWIPSSEWRARARFGLTYNNNSTEKFISPEDTRQILNKPATRLGEFSASNSRGNQYEGDVSVAYAKMIDFHRINLVAGGNINSKNNLLQGYSAEGFPAGDFTYPNFARGYTENGTPTYVETISRSVNGYFNAGYALDDRYMADLSLRSSGSSIFGNARSFSTTWSVGLGWNLHREKFIMNNASWINFLKIRASVGNPGNQNFESGRTLLTYAFSAGVQNYFGLGAVPDQVGNQNLEWQVTKDKNIGLDLTVLDRRLSMTFDYFHKVTNPLLITIDMPLSAGVSQYFTNAGEQVSQGLNFSAAYQILRDTGRRLLWSVRANGRTQKIRIDNIGDRLRGFNEGGRGTSTTRYYDGSDPDDIWVVKSFGIDPSTGKELFLTKDGEYTYDFSYNNEVLLGNKRPEVEGVLGTSFTLKGFTLSMNFRYQFGAEVFNSAVLSKVENINQLYNQDRRALYERWKQPGDITIFKNIRDVNPSPMSSRFLQRDNTIALESLYAEYQFTDGWIRKAGLGNFRVFASVRDLVRFSTIRVERGTEYPFARVIDAGLSFNF